MHVEVKSRSTFSPEDQAAIEALSGAVYPPEVVATSPGRDFTWSQPQYSIFVHDDAGHLVSHVGVLTRGATLNGTAVQIGGIGGVSTHPDYRSRGYAAAGIKRAVDSFIENPSIAFALLVCQRNVAPYYARLGWQPFEGVLVVEQPNGRVQFTLNMPMVFPIHAEVPKSGEIDLCGAPW